MSVEVEGTVSVGQPEDQLVSQALTLWLRTKDSRVPTGAVVLALYEDGCAIQYLGSQMIDFEELEGIVLAIADQIRATPGPRRQRGT